MSLEDDKFMEAVIVAGTTAAKYHTWEMVNRVLDERVQGDFAEAGVFCGGHPAIMARALTKRGDTSRKIHLFDSFQGIPNATELDNLDNQKTYGLRQGAILSSRRCEVDLKSFDYFMKMWEVDQSAFVFHPGWFEEVMEAEAKTVGPLAYLRVDVDLALSTKLVYENLYEKVVSGGIVVDDDYGLHKDSPTACRITLDGVFARRGWPSLEWKEVDGNNTTSWARKP